MAQARVNITLNLEDKATKKLMAQAGKIGKIMTGIGIAVTGTMALAIKGHVEAGVEIGKLARLTGIATEAISKFRYAAEQSGISSKDLGTALEYTTRMINEASNGSKVAQDLFTKLGLDFKSIADLKPEDQIMAIAGALNRVTDPAILQALPKEVAMLGDMSALLTEAEGKGAIFSEEDVARAEAFSASLNQVKNALQTILMEVIPPLIDAIKPFIDQVSEIGLKVRDWLKENPQLAATIIRITAAAGALMLVLGPMLMILPGIVAGISTLIVVFTAMTLPIAAVIAAIGILIAIGVVAWQHWDTIISDLKRLWQSLPAPAKAIFSAIFDFIMAPVKAVRWLIEAIKTLYAMLFKQPQKAVVGVGGDMGGFGDLDIRSLTEVEYEAPISDEVFNASRGASRPTGIEPLSEGGVPVENVINLTLNLDGEPIAQNVMRHAGQLYMQRDRLGG